MFSSRFHWDFRPNRVTGLLAEKRRAGARVLALTESNPTHAQLVYHGGWSIDLDALRPMITERTRAIVLVNPNNPTGSYVSAVEWEALGAMGVPLISDEVFADYGFDGRVADPPAATYTMSGLS